MCRQLATITLTGLLDLFLFVSGGILVGFIFIAWQDGANDLFNFDLLLIVSLWVLLFGTANHFRRRK